jgi:hypothetical protein
VDWQQPVALGIVALTAGVFLWRRFRPRRFLFARDTACGCAGTGTGVKPPGLVISGRRGERPRCELKP